MMKNKGIIVQTTASQKTTTTPHPQKKNPKKHCFLIKNV